MSRKFLWKKWLLWILQRESYIPSSSLWKAEWNVNLQNHTHLKIKVRIIYHWEIYWRLGGNC
jgi:hypothetical protein